MSNTVKFLEVCVSCLFICLFVCVACFCLFFLSLCCVESANIINYRKGTSIRQAPVFRHLGALRKNPWKFMNFMNELYYTACCWFPTSSNILILPSQFWQIGFESYWLHCWKCRILVLLWYIFFWNKIHHWSGDYTLLKSDVITWSVVMDPMNAGSRIINFIVNFIRDGTVSA